MRFQHIGFVGFDDTSQLQRTFVHRAGNKSVAPAKAGGAVHVDLVGDIAHSARFKQTLQKRKPLFLLAQARQRCSAERIVGPRAMAAAEPLQAAGAAATMRSLTPATRTRRDAGGSRNEGQAFAGIDDGCKPGAQPAKLIGT